MFLVWARLALIRWTKMSVTYIPKQMLYTVVLLCFFSPVINSLLLFCIISNVSLFVVYYLMVLHERSVVGFRESSKISGAIDFFQMYSGFGVMVVGVVMINYHRKLFFGSLHEVVLIDRKLKMLFPHQKYNRTRNIIFGK